MKNIAILAGGFDAERVISLKSAQVVKRSLNSNHYLAYIIDIDKDLWRSEEGYVIDKNDFLFKYSLRIQL